MNFNLNDDLIDSYSYSQDPLLLKNLHSWDRTYIGAILSYDSGVGGFGKQMMAHQNRVAKLGQEFLLYLGFTPNAAYNFRAAMLFHDIGKTHSTYNPMIWNLFDRPTPEQKLLQKKHAKIGADMVISLSKRQAIEDHPHIKVRHAVTLYHHERADKKGPEKENLDTLPIFVQVSALVDTFDGDQIYRPHQTSKRTPIEAMRRMLCLDGQEKYRGAFPRKIIRQFSQFIQKKYDARVH
jgi:response regulator RpfG family c-di-GMP phosphodiesterase